MCVIARRVPDEERVKPCFLHGEILSLYIASVVGLNGCF